MTNPVPSNEGLAGDLVATTVYDLSAPREREFLPWHRPRKQFVRQHQWCDQIQRLLGDLPSAPPFLRYLGLPGGDLLDLRHIYSEVCEPAGIGLRFLGFNSAAQGNSAAASDLNISLDEVRRLPRVDPASQILPDDFARLADSASVAWKHALGLGPFDVVNLDLCDGLASCAPSDIDDTHYDALSNLLALQARRAHPWLLLITTRVGTDHVHDEVMGRLTQKVVDNIANCAEFRGAAAAFLGVADAQGVRAGILSEAVLLPIFLCGLTKWLIKKGLDCQPPNITSVKSVIGYRVMPGIASEDLVSIALRIKPTFISGPDAMGLARRSVNLPDECASAVRALDRIVKRRDADAILAADSTLMGAMLEASAGLLEGARYDPVAYRLWAGEYSS